MKYWWEDVSPIKGPDLVEKPGWEQLLEAARDFRPGGERAVTDEQVDQAIEWLRACGSEEDDR